MSGQQNSCVSKVTNSWRTFLSYFNMAHQIHPLEPIGQQFCEFIVIDSKLHLRVIHVNPNSSRKSLISRQFPFHFNSNRNSLSEEYWFTKCNKPYIRESCNCSFRRSLKYSVLISDSKLSIPKIELCNDRISSQPISKIKNVESFVESLVQETLYEVLQEYYVKTRYTNRYSNGAVNLGFTDTENLTKSPENQSQNSFKRPRCKRHTKELKPLIMLCHGIGNSAEVWSLIISSLASRGYEVVAPDMLGHGYSSAPNTPSNYNFHNLLQHAITIFDHYIESSDRKCILIGHSYGCSIVTALYRHRASQVSQMILISGGGPTPLAAPIKNNNYVPFSCIQTFLSPLIFCGLKRSFFYASCGKNFKVLDETGIPKNVLQYVIDGQNWPEGDAAFHRRILVPTLLVYGLQDKEITLVQECEMERTIPRAFLELIPNAGHMAMLETPEHLTHMILCFIDWWT